MASSRLCCAVSMLCGVYVVWCLCCVVSMLCGLCCAMSMLCGLCCVVCVDVVLRSVVILSSSKAFRFCMLTMNG